MQELSGVSEATRDRALARFRLIQLYLEEPRSLQLVASDANLSFRSVFYLEEDVADSGKPNKFAYQG